MPSSSPVRLAMWSGPRNISTAMMRSWGNRPDTFVCDEPLYAYYLRETGLAHPLADEITAANETDWRRVVDWLTGPVPDGKQVFYQKHMTHHALDSIGLGWLDSVTNCFLIRDPAEMLASYLKKNTPATLAGTGMEQQVRLFEHVHGRTGVVPPVLDARDVLTDPERMLRLLCAAVDVEFTPAMLEWPPGLRSTDGLWARHWYPEVETSVGFRSYQRKSDPVPAEYVDMLDRCRACYEQLHPYRLGAD